MSDNSNLEVHEADSNGGETDLPGFDSFNLNPAILRGVAEAGFQTPSPIQEQAIPVIMAGHDMVGQAHTGTGKTAAFGLPGLNSLKIDSPTVQMLVITPTRELANQVSEEIYKLGKFLPVHTAAVYGGQSYTRQIDSIHRGAQVVVATPGRLLDLLKSGRLKKQFKPTLVVLDEADEMLDMGFLEDIQKIFSYLPEERQTLLFSATMPPPIRVLSETFLKNPKQIQVQRTEAQKSDIKQLYYVIDEHERDDATVRLIDSMNPSKAVVFCRTKKEADRVAGTLAGRGMIARPIHGDLDQNARERVIAAFRKGEVQVLVATDVAARGIDVPEISHVFNYHIPFDSESYVHRIGRTGRAGRTGVAVTMVTPGEYHELRRIKSRVGTLENQLIPTHRDLKKVNEKRLIEELRKQPVDPDAERLLLALGDEMGLAQAANKLAGLLLAQNAVTGPDRIGVQGSRLERLQAGPSKSGAPSGKKGRPGQGPRSGGSRFGGSKFGSTGAGKFGPSTRSGGGFKPGGKFGGSKDAGEGGAGESGFAKKTGGYPKPKPGFSKTGAGKPGGSKPGGFKDGPKNFERFTGPKKRKPRD